jgi:AraC-like DNA-binding protein
MLEARTEFPVRPEWMYQVRSACQLLQCRVWQADRPQFEDALGWLSEAVPSAISPQETEALKDFLKIGAVEAARVFHRAYHEQHACQACVASPVEAVLHVWAGHHADPRVLFKRWTEAFLSAFDATHPLSPTERAAAILRVRFRNPPALNALAIETGSCRSGLTRGFRQRYGISCGEYVTRVRLRWFIDEVRKPSPNAGRLAEEAGYNRYHNLLDALRRTTGLTPGEVRQLVDNDVRDLFELKLGLRPANLHVRRLPSESRPALLAFLNS